MLITKNLIELDEYVNGLVKNGDVPAINVGIVTKEGNWMTSHGFKQNLMSIQPNSLDTMYDLASITKAVITAPCILKLVEEKKIKLDQPVSKYVTKFKDKSVTIFQCLTHTSGLPNDIKDYYHMDKDKLLKAIYNAEVDKKMVGKTNYSHINYFLLGMVVNKCKGSLATYAQTVLFEPLNMQRSMFTPEYSLRTNCAATEVRENRGGCVVGEVHDQKAYTLGGITGSAGAFCAIQDLMNFITMILNNGMYRNGVQVLSHESIELLTTCQTGKNKESRTCGWSFNDDNYPIGKFHSDKVIYHSGFTGCSVLIDLGKEMGAIILTNRIHPTRNNTAIDEERESIHNLIYKSVKPSKKPKDKKPTNVIEVKPSAKKEPVAPKKEPVKKEPAKKPVTKKVADKKAPTKKVATKKAAKPVKKTSKVKPTKAVKAPVKKANKTKKKSK